MTFLEIKTNIKANLGNSAFYSVTDITDSVQDAYDEIVTLSQCIVKKIVISFQNNLNYYNFQDQTNFPAIYVADFIAATALFNNNTKQWLLDNKTLRDFDLDREDWENWIAQPLYWAPTNDYKRIAIVPKFNIAVGNFDLYYWAAPPTVVDSETPLLPPDYQNLIELYSTADLLEQAEEFSKAAVYWEEFYGIKDGNQFFDRGIYALARRSKDLAKSDLLRLVKKHDSAIFRRNNRTL